MGPGVLPDCSHNERNLQSKHRPGQSWQKLQTRHSAQGQDDALLLGQLTLDDGKENSIDTWLISPAY